MMTKTTILCGKYIYFLEIVCENKGERADMTESRSVGLIKGRRQERSKRNVRCQLGPFLRRSGFLNPLSMSVKLSGPSVFGAVNLAEQIW